MQTPFNYIELYKSELFLASWKIRLFNVQWVKKNNSTVFSRGNRNTISTIGLDVLNRTKTQFKLEHFYRRAGRGQKGRFLFTPGGVIQLCVLVFLWVWLNAIIQTSSLQCSGHSSRELVSVFSSNSTKTGQSSRSIKVRSVCSTAGCPHTDGKACNPNRLRVCCCLTVW